MQAILTGLAVRMFLFYTLCLIWGTSFILMKHAGHVFGPIGICAYRVAIGGAFLLALMWKGSFWGRPKVDQVRQQRDGRLLGRADAWALLLLSIVGYALPFWIQPVLITRLNNSGFVGMMVVFVPLFTVIVSIPILKRYPTPRELFGVVGGLIFLAVIYWDSMTRAIKLSEFLLAATTPLCYALANTYVKRRFADVDPLALSTTALLLTGFLFSPVSWYLEPIATGHDRFWSALLALMALAVVCTGVATYMFYGFIKEHGPLYAGMVAYVIPLVALLWGWVFGESITATQVAALFCVLGMVAVVQWQPKNTKAHPSHGPQESFK